MLRIINRSERIVCIFCQNGSGQVQAVRCLAAGPGPGKTPAGKSEAQRERPTGPLHTHDAVIQGLQGRDIEFASRERNLLGEVVEQVRMSPAEHQRDGQQGIQDSPGTTSHQYDRTGNVSLYSCMQTTVPEPYSSGSPTHLNMPGGGQQQQSKYLSSNLQDKLHPSKSGSSGREFSTYAALRSQAAGTITAQGFSVEAPCPQGVQGDDCVRYQLWKDNCSRFGLVNCDEQLQSVQAGRKTLSTIFQEQDQLIKEIVRQYQTEEMSSQSSASPARPVQEDDHGQETTQDVNWHRRSPTVLSLLEQSNPCPQGVQGDNCMNFKEWLHNCNRYGLSNCEDQLRGFQQGRRTLAQIIKEQEQLIASVALQYRSQAQSGQVSSHLQGSQGEGPATSPPPPPPEGQLSQRQRLQRAVKEYGATVVVFHVGISLISLGSFYLAVSSGIDVIGLLSKVGVGDSILESRFTAGASTFVMAYAVHKVFAPVRIAITLTSTPFIVRYLRRIGFLKPPKIKGKA